VVWSNIQGSLLLVLIKTRIVISEGANAQIQQQRQEAEEKKVLPLSYSSAENIFTACAFLCVKAGYPPLLPFETYRITREPLHWYSCAVSDKIPLYIDLNLFSFIRLCVFIVSALHEHYLLLMNADCCHSDGWSSCRSNAPGAMFNLFERLETRARESQVYCNGLLQWRTQGFCSGGGGFSKLSGG